MDIKNVYSQLNTTTYDTHVLQLKSFILQPYQVIPKYYLYSNPQVTKLILAMSTGSGKSAAGTFALLRNLEIYRMYKFIKQYSTPGNKFLKTNTVNNNVIVVGGWITRSQILIELLREEFHQIKPEIIEEIKTKLSSPLEEIRLEGEEMKQKQIRVLDKDIKFVGYQAFFNMIFPNVQSEKYSQNIDALVQEYDRGELTISEEFKQNYANSIILIDEMQKLYSNGGLNTYGFAVGVVAKQAKKLNLKLLFLSGTMINSSLGEIPDILSIISDDTKFYRKEDFCNQEYILDDVPIWRLKPEKIPFCISMFKPNFMYYNQSERLETEKPILTNVNKLSKSIFIPDYMDNKFQALVFPQRNLLPTEIHIGNKLINDINSKQPIILYSVTVEGLQAKKYEEYVKNNLTTANINEIESETTTHIHDAYIPPRKEWTKYSIYEENGDVLWGKFLDMSNIRKFSVIGYELCRLCIENSIKHEKTVVYHNKLNSFGIKQYAAILQYNGFVKYGDSPGERSLCMECGKKYHLHSLPLEDRLKQKVCNNFSGMYYDMLTGDLNKVSRDELVNTVFNNPKNLYGSVISVMFVSDVAYSGVSFFNTQNLCILSRIPNISKWKQIYARIIRTRSHALLPNDKQYAKIYTFVIELPDEKKKFKQLKQYTLGERYYKIREILNEDIESFMSLLSKECISSVLFHKPDEYKVNESEMKICNEMFNSDLRDEIKLIIKRIMWDDNTRIWRRDVFLKRMKDSALSVSYLNLMNVPTNILMNLMIQNKLITLFQYERNDKNIYVRLNTDVKGALMNDDLSSFHFGQIANINTKKSNLNTLLAMLENEDSMSAKIAILSKILKLVNKKYGMLVDKRVFWDTMYELGNEYYPDDEENFINNHMRENRNVSLYKGCYYGQEVILMDGSSKIINYSFPVVNGTKNMPFLFKISCLAISENSPFYLHVNVVRMNEGGENDKRRVNKGLVCTSMNISELFKYFPKLNKELHKKDYCRELLYEVCELQSKTEEKFVYTPFEK